MFKKLAVTIILLLSTTASAFPAESTAGKNIPAIVASTSIIAEMVEMLAGESIRAQVLIAPGACPGHFDLRPADAMRISGARILIRHGFQGYLDRKLSAQNPGLKIIALQTKGALLIPENLIDGLGNLKALLIENFPAESALIERNYPGAVDEINSLSNVAGEKLEKAGIEGTLVQASVQQAEFARWAGLIVTAEFPNEIDGLTMLKLKELVSSARKNDVSFIVGNYQGSGREISAAIAAGTGLPSCTISNFPGAENSAQKYPQLLLESIDQLIATAHRAGNHGSGY